MNETGTIWNLVSERQPTARGFDSDGPWAYASHLAIGAETVESLDADMVRGSLLAIANAANWAAYQCCDPAAGHHVRQEIWELTRRLGHTARRLGEELLRYEVGEGDDDE